MVWERLQLFSRNITLSLKKQNTGGGVGHEKGGGKNHRKTQGGGRSGKRQKF